MSRLLSSEVDNLKLKISIAQFRYKLFRSSLASFVELTADTTKVENSESMSHFIYSFVELCYYISNSACSSSLNMLFESAIESDFRNMEPIDVFSLTELAQTLLDFQYIMMVIDDNANSRNRALIGLDRITLNNPLELSQKWSSGETVTGGELMFVGMPISLDLLKITLETMSKIETDNNNKELIKKIQDRLKNI